MLEYSYLQSTIITLNVEPFSLPSIKNDMLGKMNLTLVQLDIQEGRNTFNTLKIAYFLCSFLSSF